MKTPTLSFWRPTLISALALAGCLMTFSSFGADFSENFDSYATGSLVGGQGGWKGWDNDPSVYQLAPATSTFSFSGANSVRIVGTSFTGNQYTDLVHEFAGITSGQWSLTAKQYIPGSSTVGISYFIVMNRYADGNPGGVDSWGSQANYNLATGTAGDANGGTSATPTLVRDQWVDIRFDIDLNANKVSEYYNGQLFVNGRTWSSVAFRGIQAIDLFTDVTSSVCNPVFYDNISLTAVPEPGSLTIFAASALVAGAWLRRRKAA